MAGFKVLTVSQVTMYLKSTIDSDDKLRGIYLRGEIADLRDNFGSGHIYFTLKDGSASLRAVMFQSYASRMRFRLSNGMSVIVRGDISLYQRDGSCQLYAFDAQPDGVGAGYVSFEQLKEKLAAAGLFKQEHKRPIPRYPEHIGVITSASGAALHDIIQVLGRRWPLAEIVFSPVTVQGDRAALQMVKAIELQNIAALSEVIIIGRGGGSAEDLFVFNDEALAHAIYNSKIPVISAVGHETDYTICDFVSDSRAPTPSAAAELASPDIRELMNYFTASSDLLASKTRMLIGIERKRLADNGKERLLRAVKKIYDADSAALDSAVPALIRASSTYMKEKHAVLLHKTELLDSFSPTKQLLRGYAGVSIKGQPLVKIGQVSPGDCVNITLSDGDISAEVKAIEKRPRD